MTIAEIVATIRNAIYGKDVRESIAKGIETINESTIQQINVISTDTNSKIVNITTDTDVKLATMNSTIENNNNGADGKINSMMGEISEFKTKVNGDVTTIATNVTTKVNALDSEVELRTPQFGSNLLKATEDFSLDYWHFDMGASIIPKLKGMLTGYSMTSANIYVTQGFILKQGIQYTLSAWIKSDTTMTSLKATIDTGDNASINLFTYANKWYRYSYTFVVEDTFDGLNQIGITKPSSDNTSTVVVCGMQLAEGTNQGYVPSLSKENEQEKWKYIPLDTGWKTIVGEEPAQYYKDTLSRAHLRSGWFAKNVDSPSNSICTLPPGYRPDKEVKIQIMAMDTSGNTIMKKATFSTSGLVEVNHLGLDLVNLDGANWRAEQ